MDAFKFLKGKINNRKQLIICLTLYNIYLSPSFVLCLSIFLSFYLSVSFSFCQLVSVSLSCLSVFLYVSSSVSHCPFASICVSLSLCLSSCLLVSQPLCLFFFFFFSISLFRNNGFSIHA